MPDDKLVAKPALDWQSSCATHRCSFHHCPFYFPGLPLPFFCLPALMTVRSCHKMLDNPVQYKTIPTGFTGLVLYCCRKIEAAHRVVQCFLVTAWDLSRSTQLGAGGRCSLSPISAEHLASCHSEGYRVLQAYTRLAGICFLVAVRILHLFFILKKYIHLT